VWQLWRPPLVVLKALALALVLELELLLPVQEQELALQRLRLLLHQLVSKWGRRCSRSVLLLLQRRKQTRSWRKSWPRMPPPTQLLALGLCAARCGSPVGGLCLTPCCSLLVCRCLRLPPRAVFLRVLRTCRTVWCGRLVQALMLQAQASWPCTSSRWLVGTIPTVTAFGAPSGWPTPSLRCPKPLVRQPVQLWLRQP
jgi:hypothetical protein